MAEFAGAALVCLGFSAFGIAMAMRLKRRAEILEAFIWAIDYIETEISYGLMPLDELLAELERRPSALRDFWKTLAQKWKPGELFSDVWTDGVSTLDMREQDMLLAGEIGNVLGHYDAERQVSRLRFIKSRLEYAKNGALGELQKNGRLFCVAGVLFGLVMAIALI